MRNGKYLKHEGKVALWAQAPCTQGNSGTVSEAHLWAPLRPLLC